MARRSMTYGVMPALEEFDAACAEPDDECGKSVDDVGFSFGNDPRIGTDTLTGTELWNELQKARAEFEAGDEKAGDWCSGVLGCLGFEWV
jgi:hypothetical protein